MSNTTAKPKKDKRSKESKEQSKKSANILTIWANDDTQQFFKKQWKQFNKTITGTVTQEEYLKMIIEAHKDQMRY